MTQKMNCQFRLLRSPWAVAALVLLLLTGAEVPCQAQLGVGSISGTVMDVSGATVQDAVVKARNVGTNLEVTVHADSTGSYSISNLPVGTYTLSMTKAGFETETHTEVIVTGDRTTTVNGSLKVGAVSTTVEVTAVALMNQTDTTNGYVVDQLTIQDTPLGTGSFTQLAILAPGVHADFLGGGGTNTGLGNQAVFANGNRDTSNSFTLDGISTNNIFNGNSTSNVGENRFVVNTGENFGAADSIQTSTSVVDAIGQALPTPPLDTIQEIAVNAAMYDASQGNNSGAHISVLTKSGTNQMHGSAWEQWQNSDLNAAPFFYNASPAITVKDPYANRNQFGATLGGPLKKDKLFYFLSYQGVRISDASAAIQDVAVPLGLTSTRTAAGIAASINSSYNLTGTKALTATQINPAAVEILGATLPNGPYLIPTPQITNASTAKALGYDAVVQGKNSLASVDQGIGNIDYVLNEKDRLSGKYYVQTNPTSNPFGAVGSLLGFAQQLSAGSQVGSITNNVILSPTITWEQHIGYTRLKAYAATGSDFNPTNLGMNLLGSTTFPEFDIESGDPTIGHGFYFGPSLSFGNAGMYQNQGEAETSLHMVEGSHTIALGMQWDHTQLNLINNNTTTDYLVYTTFENFAEGNAHGGDAFAGSASRYYRADTAGAYANDNWKMRSDLTLTYGLRWDFDGPFSEKYGKLTGFNANAYAYNVAADSIGNSGLEIAGNNPSFATPGASNSLMNNRQWGLSPRIGIAWSPKPQITLRAGAGMYFDRGELFSYFSPPAGAGFNGPFGVTLAPPFVQPIAALTTPDSLSAPFGTTQPAAPPGSAAAFTAYLPNISQTEKGSKAWPAGNLFGPFVFGGYDINNKLPYTENWTLDLQYQASNNWLLEIAYVGNHGQHEVLPIPFNQPLIATPESPLLVGGPNQQIYSYGGVNIGSCCKSEPISTSEFSGNAPIRVPYPGYDMNSVTYNAEGISNYDALQVQIHKRLSIGLQFTAAYTYSHALDEQSGLGLFVTGNNPQTPRANYASADFDQTHVFLLNYSYTTPNVTRNRKLGYAINSWVFGGQSVLQSGQPYSPYDYSGSVGSLYYGTDVEIANPIVPLKAGVTAKQARLQGTTSVNAGFPVLNVNDFAPQFVAPGTNGVPPCDPSGACDNYESLFGSTGRNMFRGPFQARIDMSMAKQFPIKERFQLRLELDAFNVLNQPDFDTPNNDVTFFAGFEPPPLSTPEGTLGQIQHTIGSSRFLQISMHLFF